MEIDSKLLWKQQFELKSYLGKTKPNQNTSFALAMPGWTNEAAICQFC